MICSSPKRLFRIVHPALTDSHFMHESVGAVDKVLDAAGTNATFTSLPLERALRDIHVAVQHGAALPSY